MTLKLFLLGKNVSAVGWFGVVLKKNLNFMSDWMKLLPVILPLWNALFGYLVMDMCIKYNQFFQMFKAGGPGERVRVGWSTCSNSTFVVTLLFSQVNKQPSLEFLGWLTLCGELTGSLLQGSRRCAFTDAVPQTSVRNQCLFELLLLPFNALQPVCPFWPLTPDIDEAFPLHTTAAHRIFSLWSRSADCGTVSAARLALTAMSCSKSLKSSSFPILLLTLNLSESFLPHLHAQMHWAATM